MAIMAEWLTLLFVAFAILIPVALLVGFAGCDVVYKLERRSVDVTILSAEGTDAVTITLNWAEMPPGSAQSFQVERTHSNGQVDDPIDAPSSPLVDTPLEPGMYDYRVRAVIGNGDEQPWSPYVPGATRPFVAVYAKALTVSQPNWGGYTLVQRIEAAHLAATGPYVRITVQASSAGDASIDRVYISQAAPTGNPYDSAGDLTKVYDLADNQMQPFPVPAGQKEQLPFVAYTINQLQALLIAIDFRPTASSAVGRADMVPMSEASAYYLQTTTGEAAVSGRSANYTQIPAVVLITSIEAG